MTATVLIRPELPTDQDAISNVNQLAFGSDAEANLVDALRDIGYVELSLVAEIAGKIVGHILFSRVLISGTTGVVESLSLAPMAVLPEFQRQRIGTKLLTVGLATCRATGHNIVLVLGHPAFYPKFGFSVELARPLESRFGGGEAWMALELVPKALDGVEGRVEYSLPFGGFE
ncbi:MAG: N-acetyltransferase [Fuerstiella sp.]